MKKANNSIATKMCANLLDNRRKSQNIFRARHNSMTWFSCALFEDENKIKLV